MINYFLKELFDNFDILIWNRIIYGSDFYQLK